MPVDCPSCPATHLLRSSLSTHLSNDCPQAIVPCPLSRFGCPYIGRRHSLSSDHLDNRDGNGGCAFEPIKTYLLEAEEKISNLWEENGTLRRELEVLKRTQREVENRLDRLSARLGVDVAHDAATSTAEDEEQTFRSSLSETLSTLSTRVDHLSLTNTQSFQSQEEQSHSARNDINSLQMGLHDLRGEVMALVQQAQQAQHWEYYARFMRQQQQQQQPQPHSSSSQNDHQGRSGLASTSAREGDTVKPQLRTSGSSMSSSSSSSSSAAATPGPASSATAASAPSSSSSYFPYPFHYTSNGFPPHTFSSSGSGSGSGANPMSPFYPHPSPSLYGPPPPPHPAFQMAPSMMPMHSQMPRRMFGWPSFSPPSVPMAMPFPPWYAAPGGGSSPDGAGPGGMMGGTKL